MKTSLIIYFSITVLTVVGYSPVFAQDGQHPLAKEQETPDPLLLNVDPEKRNKQYGDKDIYISGQGDKQNQLVTPDPLQRTLDKETINKETPEDIKLKSHQVTEEDKAIETPDRLLKTLKESVTGNGNENKNEDLVTPDPLLDSFN